MFKQDHDKEQWNYDQKNKKKTSKHSNNYDNLWSVEKTQVCKHHKTGCLIKFNE